MAILDAASDMSISLTKRIRDNYGFPQFVKDAVDEDLKVGAPNQEMFADPKRRKFANISPAATWLNYAMFREQQDVYSPNERAQVAETFQKHAQFWNVGHELTRLDMKLKQQAAPVTAKTASDEDYALIVTGGDGQVHRRCYVGDQEGLVKSARWLATHQENLPYRERRKVAATILERADLLEHSFDTDTSERLHKTAGIGVATPHNVSRVLTSRAVLAEGQTKGMLYKIADDVKAGQFDLSDTEVVCKLAEQLDQMDRDNEWTGRYKKAGLLLPEDIYDFTPRKIASLRHEIVETRSGYAYSKDQFKGLDMEELADHVGTEFTKRASVDDTIDPDLIAAVLKTASYDTAVAFDRFMAVRGVTPLRYPDLSVRREPEAGAWAEIASAYQPSSAV